jgi:hypothetical protein
MAPSYIGNRDPRLRGLLHDPKLLVDGIPSTALNTRINLNILCSRRHSPIPCIRSHSPMTRLTPSSYLRQTCPVEMGAAPATQSKFAAMLADLPKSALIATEACSSSNYWGRYLTERGYRIALIPSQHVKPFAKPQKNDANNALLYPAAASAAALTGVHLIITIRCSGPTKN